MRAQTRCRSRSSRRRRTTVTRGPRRRAPRSTACSLLTAERRGRRVGRAGGDPRRLDGLPAVAAGQGVDPERGATAAARIARRMARARPAPPVAARRGSRGSVSRVCVTKPSSVSGFVTRRRGRRLRHGGRPGGSTSSRAGGSSEGGRLGRLRAARGRSDDAQKARRRRGLGDVRAGIRPVVARGAAAGAGGGAAKAARSSARASSRSAVWRSQRGQRSRWMRSQWASARGSGASERSDSRCSARSQRALAASGSRVRRSALRARAAAARGPRGRGRPRRSPRRGRRPRARGGRARGGRPRRAGTDAKTRRSARSRAAAAGSRAVSMTLRARIRPAAARRRRARGPARASAPSGRGAGGSPHAPVVGALRSSGRAPSVSPSRASVIARSAAPPGGATTAKPRPARVARRVALTSTDSPRVSSRPRSERSTMRSSVPIRINAASRAESSGAPAASSSPWGRTVQAPVPQSTVTRRIGRSARSSSSCHDVRYPTAGLLHAGAASTLGKPRKPTGNRRDRMSEYAKDVLVDTDWVEQHLDDDGIRIVEVDENPALYAEAHIPGAIGFDWRPTCRTRSSATSSGPRPSASCSARAGSPTTTRSCSTATATTGSPPTPTGTSGTTATTRSSWSTARARSGSPRAVRPRPTSLPRAGDVHRRARRRGDPRQARRGPRRPRRRPQARRRALAQEYSASSSR